MNLRVFTAFSGYDSQCLALELLKEYYDATKMRCISYELIGWSEIDKFAIQAHNALFPQWSERNYGDIAKIDWESVPDFDLFTYSSPCQDFSQAGRQAGGAKGSGTRSSLLWECERAIIAKRPKYLLFENVKAVMSKKFVGLLQDWQHTLERLGYTNFTQVLNAKEYGFPTPVPQNRERVFMVSILDCKCEYSFPDKKPNPYCIADILEDIVDERYYLSKERLAGLQWSTQKEKQNGRCFAFKPKDIRDIAFTLSSKGGGRKTDNFIKVVGDLQPDNKRQNSNVTRQQNMVISSNGISKAISSSHNLHPFSIVEPQVLGWTIDKTGKVVNYHPVDVANAITSAKRDNTQNYVQKTLVRMRRLTPRECFRLMGVSDTNIDTIQSAGISMTQQYKLAGNSIVVNCLADILRQLIIYILKYGRENIRGAQLV